MPTKRTLIALAALAIGTLPLGGCMMSDGTAQRGGYSYDPSRGNTQAQTPPGQASAVHR